MPNHDFAEAFSELIHETRHTLRYLAETGVKGFECTPETLQVIERWGRPAAPNRPAVDSLEAIRADLGECRRCPLWRQRKNIVFGEGHAQPRLVFVGEGPGYEEDQSGRPFVGAAGRLLDRIIQAMRLKRDEIYICNIVKCRPPRNRAPQPEEIETCVPFLKRQLAALNPQVICTLGATAAKSLLAADVPISALRGRFHDYKGIHVMPIFHPAYLLRNPEKKRETWDDLQQVMQLLGI